MSDLKRGRVSVLELVLGVILGVVICLGTAYLGFLYYYASEGDITTRHVEEILITEGMKEGFLQFIQSERKPCKSVTRVIESNTEVQGKKLYTIMCESKKRYGVTVKGNDWALYYH